ncbi:MAG TPA: hypothetical protein VG839_04845 [Asticcacaulis sp.]|nr:hypothetical protein [Asticcacaulis sp.]
MKLSIDFAFEGFRIVRQKPQVVLAWGVISLIGNGLALYALMAMAGPAFQDLMKMQGSAAATQDPQAVLAVFAKLLPAYGVMILVAVIMGAIITCAVFRCVLESGKGGFGYLALGGDEIRQILLSIVNIFLIVGLELAALLAAGIIGGLIGLVLSMLAKPLAAIGFVVGFVIFIWFFCWGLLRLSLNSAQSFAEKKFNAFGSVSLTQGHAFTLLGGYIITGIMALLVYGACMIIFMAIAAGFSHGNVAALSIFDQTKMMTPDGMKNPLVIAYFVVMYLLVTPLMMALTYGAPAAAYNMLRGHTTQVQNVF